MLVGCSRRRLMRFFGEPRCSAAVCQEGQWLSGPRAPPDQVRSSGEKKNKNPKQNMQIKCFLFILPGILITWHVLWFMVIHHPQHSTARQLTTFRAQKDFAGPLVASTPLMYFMVNLVCARVLVLSPRLLRGADCCAAECQGSS